MPRHREITRQWNVLKTLDASRHGATLEVLADAAGVHTRTIRRDLDALTEAGFMVYDEVVDGKRRYLLERPPFKGIADTGFSLMETCALYFSRSLVECLAAAPFADDLGSAFDKIQAVIPAATRRFLDALPAMVSVKTGTGDDRPSAAVRANVATLVDATLHHRRLAMRYHSMARDRVADYVVEPHRVVHGLGALYLVAYVPAYDQVRTFAVSRIQRASPTEEHFVPPAHLDRRAFPHSLGVYTGEPVPVVLRFTPAIARYVVERAWHPSQHVVQREDGGLDMHLHVCDDWALRSWILSFGSNVQVVSPDGLARRIADELGRARDAYATPLVSELREPAASTPTASPRRARR